MNFLVLAVLAVLASGATYAMMRPSKAKRLRSSQLREIAEVVEKEQVRVRGVVSADEVLRAPYTGRECVYYRLEITQDEAHQRRDFTTEDRRDFRLTDKSGVAEVLVEGAEFEVTCDYVEMERASRVSERAREIAQHNEWKFGEIAQLTISEGIVPAGESVELVGVAMRVPAKKPGVTERSYRDLPETTPVFSNATILGEDREPTFLDAK